MPNPAYRNMKLIILSKPQLHVKHTTTCQEAINTIKRLSMATWFRGLTKELLPFCCFCPAKAWSVYFSLWLFIFSSIKDCCFKVS
ncbi:hypothetical protein OIU77_029731 [Salix suchowensis]|uniref:Uncharacterized protein n=1 Tax=Salix suchowensis TaxID=1278906 RepID=A0ABQ9BCQ8_9ROSI|nr:hypothetical protein OIU77_029731 [Salix suchowensis]